MIVTNNNICIDVGILSCAKKLEEKKLPLLIDGLILSNKLLKSDSQQIKVQIKIIDFVNQ
jgi:hypothetical protein